VHPSSLPSVDPSESPSVSPSSLPSSSPSLNPSSRPSTSPSSSPSGGPSQSPIGLLLCNGQNGQFQLSLTTDRYASETSWSLVETNNPYIAVASSTPYQNEKTYTINPSNEPKMCLQVGVEYTFTMVDSYGDGLCCDYGYGGFSLTLDGVTIETVTEFGFNSTKTFFV